MTFAQLRQTVLQAHALSDVRFAELVQISSPTDVDELLDVKVKIEHEQIGPKKPSYVSGSGNEDRRGTFDERERVRVQVSRDPDWQYGYPGEPQPGARLIRAESIDSDRRPFAFRGEVIFKGDQHAVYMFERPRRVGQGRGY